MSTILDSLVSNHEEQRALLNLVEKTHGNSHGRRELFRRLTDELEAHLRVEERVLYSRLLQTAEGRELAAHSVAEHEEARELLAELAATDMSSPGWILLFRRLKLKLELHFNEEESRVFPDARTILGIREIALAGARFDRDGAVSR